MTRQPELTEHGRQYAVLHADDSMVASVALMGYASDWPHSHVATAIEAVNRRADASRRGVEIAGNKKGAGATV